VCLVIKDNVIQKQKFILQGKVVFFPLYFHLHIFLRLTGHQFQYCEPEYLKQQTAPLNRIMLKGAVCFVYLLMDIQKICLSD